MNESCKDTCKPVQETVEKSVNEMHLEKSI
jgi:hypothetical protein